jgi:nucleoside-diphosphate-sugar epimerase
VPDRERTAFVTGGSGFVGGRLLRRLVADGWAVRALARSSGSARAVEERGADAVPGDLDSIDSMRGGAEDCGVAFHAAALVTEWASDAAYEQANVIGTSNALQACHRAGVSRFVNVSTVGVIQDGRQFSRADESLPLALDSPWGYSTTKARAEALVARWSKPGFETVSIRPEFVWGPADTTLVPAITEKVRAGQFVWISGGRHRVATSHVDNVVEALILAPERGRGGAAYFATDGEPPVFRDFLTRLMATQGVELPDRSIPLPLARAFAAGCEWAWRTFRLPGVPPLTRPALWIIGIENTVDDSRARRELGYAPVRTIDDGLAELEGAVAPAETVPPDGKPQVAASA